MPTETKKNQVSGAHARPDDAEVGSPPTTPKIQHDDKESAHHTPSPDPVWVTGTPTETDLNTLLKNQVNNAQARLHDAEVASQKTHGDKEPPPEAPPADPTPPIQVVGTSKNDTFHGTGHDEAFTGGRGSDVFVFDHNIGHDTIKDFGAGGHDVIWFQQGVFHNYQELSSHTTREGDNLVITIDEHNSITLEHYTGHLNPLDFVLDQPDVFLV